MASDPAVGKLPRSQFSELRIRKPNSQTAPLIPNSRYAEIRTPTTAANNTVGAPTVNQPGDDVSKRFGAGWYYIKLARSAGASSGACFKTNLALVRLKAAATDHWGRPQTIPHLGKDLATSKSELLWMERPSQDSH
jgi:hypothetical protein